MSTSAMTERLETATRELEEAFRRVLLASVGTKPNCSWGELEYELTVLGEYARLYHYAKYAAQREATLGPVEPQRFYIRPEINPSDGEALSKVASYITDWIVAARDRVQKK